MSARRLQDELVDVAEKVLGTLAAPGDTVLFDLAFGNAEIECDHDGDEPTTTMVPSISLYVSLRCPEYAGSISGCADLPIMMAGTPEGFSVGLEKLWDEISFRRIALALPDVARNSIAILGDQPELPE